VGADNPILTGGPDAPNVCPTGANPDARKLLMYKSMAERFMVACDDWGVTSKTVEGQIRRFEAKATDADCDKAAQELLPKKYLEGRKKA